MNKMNKKGFTLIEMLVVIAIIAVLVAIIIPTVSSSTTKAKAAADAANLRSLVAEATTDLLSGGDNNEGLVTFVSATKTFTAKAGSAPTGKSTVVKGNSAFIYLKTDGTVNAYFAASKIDDPINNPPTYDINYFATKAAS